MLRSTASPLCSLYCFCIQFQGNVPVTNQLNSCYEMFSCYDSERLVDSYDALLSANYNSRDRAKELSLCFFGDSHVSRMQKAFEDASCSRKIDFISKSGLCMRDTATYLERLRKFDIVIVQCGGNDVSFHPKKSNVVPDFPAHLSKSFKSFADGLGQET